MADNASNETIKNNTQENEEDFSSDSNSTTYLDSHLSIIEQKLIDLPDIWQYIISLKKIVSKQQKKLRKLRRKLKKSDTKEAATQTDFDQDTISKTITEEITEAAENAMQRQGFVYEETSGLYYDYNSGYYYNAEYGLYYDGNTGTYMSYNAEKQEYVYHSQVEAKPIEKSAVDYNINEKQGKSQERKRRRSGSVEDADLEEGECSDESCHVSECESGSSDDINIECSKQWPPCIRIIVEETSIAAVKQGSLFLITCEGGTLGREGKHDILLTDINVSKHHLKFNFNEDTGKYYIIDLGSRNGTILNGKRISSSKQESEPMEIVHGARIQVGATTLLCHIHAGSQTCGLCEPGLLQHETVKNCWSAKKPDKSLDHKQQLKKLKKKFAVDHMSDSNLAPGYTDRAQARRETVGSQNEHEKTQVASLDQSITSENKGFKLLAKMGWTEGQSLGKEGTGRLEPINLVSNYGTSGIGSKEPIPQQPKNKTNVWTKAKERYDQLQPKTEI